MSTKTEIKNLPLILAILKIEQESYTYIDKLSQTVSRELALYYIREMLRDYSSLLNSGFESKVASEASKYVNFAELKKEIEYIKGINSISELREELSYITAQAIAEAGRISYLEKRNENKKTSENPSSS
ncbi:MAG: type I-A CRISPR-associated protein Csa5 [Fervidicoccaceae archaeon]|jgi:CRISPR-associated protein Csa5